MNKPLQDALLLQNRLLEFMTIEEFNIFVTTQSANYLHLLYAAAHGIAFYVRRTPNGFAIKVSGQ